MVATILSKITITCLEVLADENLDAIVTKISDQF